MLMCLDQFSVLSKNANLDVSCATIKFRIANRITGVCVPKSAEGQRFGNQIKASAIGARVNFVNSAGGAHRCVARSLVRIALVENAFSRPEHRFLKRLFFKRVVALRRIG
jgi:hypothetical protein